MSNNNKKNKRIKHNNRKPKPRYASCYPKHLQGLPSNQYGGTNLRHPVGFKGGRYGRAGPVKIYTPEEIIDYANDNDLNVAPSVFEKAKKRQKTHNLIANGC